MCTAAAAAALHCINKLRGSVYVCAELVEPFVEKGITTSVHHQRLTKTKRRRRRRRKRNGIKRVRS
jgi:hypothetical protein